MRTSFSSSSSSSSSGATPARSLDNVRNGRHTQPVWVTSAKSRSVARSHPFASLRSPSASTPACLASGVDVVVIGGGIVGATTAYLLKAKGKSVVVLEALEVGHGTTGSSTAKLTAQHSAVYSQLTKQNGREKARAYAQQQLAALQTAEQIVKDLNIDCEWERTGSYVWTSDDAKVHELQQEYEAALEAGCPVEYIRGSPSDLPASVQAKTAVRFSGQVSFNSCTFAKAVAANVDDGTRGFVYEHSRVIDVGMSKNNPNLYTVTTKEGLVDAAKVVVASHLPILDRSLHFSFLQPDRSHCICVRTSQPHKLQDMSNSLEEPLRSLRKVDDYRLIISGDHAPVGKQPDSSTQYENLEKWARAHFPVEVVEANWSAMDYMSSEHVPYIGYLTRANKDIFTATGFSKWGLSNGIAAAKLISELISIDCDEKMLSDQHWYQMCDARRWDLMTAGKGFLAENMHTGKHMVMDHLQTWLLPHNDVNKLQNGEGGVVKAKGHTVGAYRDSEGKLHLVRPVCTHKGCAVLFNPGEKVWDCPCHGSQYDIDGSVLHGPAVHPLEKLNHLEW